MLQSLREEREGILQVLLSLRKNGLTSLIKEVSPGKNSIRPPPLSPFCGQKGIFGGEGGGVYNLEPPRQEFYTPPLFYTPPTPRRVFSGVGGVGVYKIWPRS